MKKEVKTILYILLALAALFQGCTTVYFAAPQPKETEILSSFPEELWGIYLLVDEENIDTIFIEEKSYIHPESTKKYIPVASVDSISNIRIEGDLLYDSRIPIDYGIPFSIEDDTLHYSVEYKLSVFLSDSLVLKRDQDFYVLNEREEGTDYWKSYLLKRQRNGNLKLLAVGNFQTDKSKGSKSNYDGKLEKYFSVTDFKQIDKSDYLIDPSGKEFRKLIQKGFFVELGELKKI